MLFCRLEDMSFFQSACITKVLDGNQWGGSLSSDSLESLHQLLPFRLFPFLHEFPPKHLDFLYAFDYISGLLNVLSMNVSSEMFLDHHCCIVLDSPSFFGLLVFHVLRLGWLEGIMNKEIFFLLDSWTKKRNLLLKFVVDIRVKDGFLNNFTYFIL